jgi:hypothetical protein
MAIETSLIEYLSKWLSRKNMKSKKIEKELALAPYMNQIDFIASHFDNEKKRIGAGMSGSKPSKRTILTRWLEEYVAQNSGLPEGKHKVECPFFGGKLQLGIIDFSVF